MPLQELIENNDLYIEKKLSNINTSSLICCCCCCDLEFDLLLNELWVFDLKFEAINSLVCLSSGGGGRLVVGFGIVEYEFSWYGWGE